MSAGGSTKIILIALCANFCIALSKLAGALFTGSAALMAEAVHSFSDCGNQALLLYGQRAAKKPANAKYPLGRGREVFFWSFLVALLLFSVGGSFSLYEGLHKLQHPEPVTSPFVGIIILVIAVALESYAFCACLKEVQLRNQGKSLWQWVRTTTSADLLVIFLEDAAALLGLVFALFALSMAWITGNPMWDALGSCFIGVLLIVVAVVLAREVKHMLIGEGVTAQYRDGLEAVLHEEMHGATLLKLIVLQQGVDALMVAYKIRPAPKSNDVWETIADVNRFEAAARTRYPEIQWQFTELDIRD
jgi:cation diffusion facilitator family transporter